MTRTGHRRTAIGAFLLANAVFLLVAGPFWKSLFPAMLASLPTVGLPWRDDLTFWLVQAALFFGAAAGSTAPDWLEVVTGWDPPNRRGFSKRHSLIPHRTWTHWWPFWCVLLVVGLFWSARPPALSLSVVVAGLSIGAFTMAFAVGGLTHLLVDIPNPMGIPLAGPLARYRVSLNWWKSGAHEWAIPVFMATAGGCVLFLVLTI